MSDVQLRQQVKEWAERQPEPAYASHPVDDELLASMKQMDADGDIPNLAGAPEEPRQTYGQAIADAVERYWEVLREYQDCPHTLIPQRDEAKAALAREIDDLVKFCVESCPCNTD